jgi:hypothetical protein
MTRALSTLLVLLLPAVSAIGGEQLIERTSGDRVQSALFRHQYTIYDHEFCGSEACVDFDGDGRGELLYASRSPGRLELRNAADGSVRWTRDWAGEQQSTSVFDLDGDGAWEIVYTVSRPGTLYVCNHEGELLGRWESGDDKLGNSPVVIDADGDGVLEGFFGTRNRDFVRLKMTDLTLLQRRPGWVQCGCYTTAMDVDQDGLWDLFAGSGDDYTAKGVLHRIDPLTLESTWQYATDDNASSADAVPVDIDGDGLVEVIMSVDNYKQDDAHDAVYAFETDGTLLWKVDGFSEEDSPNVADLDGDGAVEIVGMTFGGEVYCLDALGHIRWRRDLRPELDDGQHMYMTPILCDLNGDRDLEILAMTHGQYSATPGEKPTARLTALNVAGDVLDELDLGESRYWGHAYVCNVDDDSFQELVVSGFGGLDVFETRGYGPETEHFQRRRSYQRLNVRPWEYADSYFIERGQREHVVHRADSLVLARDVGGYLTEGTFTTDVLRLPPDCEFETLAFEAERPAGSHLIVNVRDEAGNLLLERIESETDVRIDRPVRLEFRFATTDRTVTPQLDAYALRFDRKQAEGETNETAVGVGQSFVITGPEHGARDCPASVALLADVKDVDQLKLVETTGGSATPIPSQVADGEVPRLWWIVRGELAAGAKRTYRLDRGISAVPATVTVDQRSEVVTVRIGDAPVLQYNIAHVDPPPEIDQRNGRNGYIHPAWTPSGTVVTEQFPADHAHQSGLFLAFVKTEFEGRTPDFWNLLGGTGRVVSKGLLGMAAGPVFGEFDAVHEHIDQSAPGSKVALNETWNVRVWNVGGTETGYWICDLTSRINCATDSPLRLPEYHYGGMALRGAQEWKPENVTFVTSEGLDRVAGNHSRPWWCDIAGNVRGSKAGILFATHPGNFRAPEPLRIHPTMPYMVYTPSFLGEWEIAPGAPHVSRYRFVFHDGDLPPETADRLQREFAEPLTAHFE